MRGMLLIARRDLAAYFNSLWGYAVVAAVLVIDGLLFNVFAVSNTARFSSDVLEDFFYFSFGVVCVAAVLLTMRLVAEEKQTGTMTLLDSSPLAGWQIVGGKYLSAMAVLGLLVALTAYMPGLIFLNGKVSMGHIGAGYLGLLLVGSATVAAGTLGSTVAQNQLVAAITSGILVVFLIITWLLARITDPPLADVFSYAALFDRHFQPFMQGRINTEGIVFYLSLTWLFLMLSTRYLAARRWR